MKVLVLGLHRAAPGLLFGDDRLAAVRRLMESGLYGRLDGEGAPTWAALVTGRESSGDGPEAVAAPTLWDWFARAGRRPRVIAEPGGAGPARPLDEVRAALGRDDWDLLFAVADGPDDYRDFDDELGSLLEALDDEAAVLILCRPGGFVLAGPGVPALGEVRGARPIDVAPTVLALAGLDVPPTMPGRPLAPTPDRDDSLLLGYTPDDEAALLGRLSGLGYI